MTLAFTDSFDYVETERKRHMTGRLPLDRVQAEPDLIRHESGYTIKLFITPSIEVHERAVVEVHAEGKILLDTLDVEFEKWQDVYRHTTLHSKPYAEALR